MRLMALATTAIVSFLICAPVDARTFTLTCDVTNYGDAGSTSGVESLVPRHSVHEVESSDAQIDGTSLIGTASDVGTRIKIRYVGQLKNIGDAEVIYTYIKSSGAMVARTRGLRTIPWDEFFPERTGQYIITGRCTRS